VAKKNKKYFQLVQANEDTADLYIFGDICKWAWEDAGEASGNTIVKQLQAVKASEINVHINSYGGDVSEGLAIYNVLREHPARVHTICDGFACSAASVVFMAGDQRTMSPASLLMIHNAWTYAMGNAAELRKTADDIEIITQASVEAYKCVATISEEEIKKLMDAETWILPGDAVAYGFATDIDEPDEDDEPQQSAFGLISQRLRMPVPAERVLAEVSIDQEALADVIAERVSAMLAARTEPRAEETDNTPVNGWDAFFKGE
jgi:ATP-dependent Clp protease protease subunit